MTKLDTAGHRPLSGSERLPAPSTIRQAPTDAAAKITASVRLRRRPDAVNLAHIDALRERGVGSPPLTWTQAAIEVVNPTSQEAARIPGVGASPDLVTAAG